MLDPPEKVETNRLGMALESQMEYIGDDYRCGIKSKHESEVARRLCPLVPRPVYECTKKYQDR